MSVEPGQRRIMPNGEYVRVGPLEYVATRKPYPHHYTVALDYRGTILFRAYGTVNSWPLTPCTNESHHCLGDCVSWYCHAGAGTLPHPSGSCA